MEKVLSEALAELKKALKEDERALLCQKREEKMMEDEEVLLLIAEKDRCEREYEDLLSYAGEKEKKEAEHRLYLAKKKLDEHPLVREYGESFIVLRDLYLAIDDVLFSPYRKKVNPCSR